MRLKAVLSAIAIATVAAPAAQAQRPPEKGEARLPVAAPGDVAAMPEGIDVDERTGTYFTGATSDGTIYRGALDAPLAETYLPAGTDGRLVAQGIEVDDERRLLFVATGPQGTVDAYDIDSKQLVGRYSTGLGGFVNDIGVTPSGDVYFTDSLRPNLYRVPAPAVRTETTAETIPIPQTGPFSYSLTSNGGVEPNAPFNAGGIDALDDRTLIVTQINEGRLFRFSVNPANTTAQITEIPIAGGADNLDGFELLDASRVLTTDNLAEEVLTVELAADASTATVVRRTSEQNFCTPTAVGLVEGSDRIVVANAQLFRPTGPPYTISSLPLPLDNTVVDNPDRGRTGTPCERDIVDGQPVPEPVGPEVAPGFADPADTPARRSPALSISRARLRGGIVSVRAAITRRAAGERVSIAVRAGGGSLNTRARAKRRPSGSRSRLRLQRRVPGAARSARTGSLHLRYGGNGAVRPFDVRLTAARRGAALTSRKPTIDGARLRTRGRLSQRARGPVRLQLAFRSAGATRTYETQTPTGRGRFDISRRLPPGVRALLADHAGPVRAYVLYQGSARRGIAGELESFNVRPR